MAKTLNRTGKAVGQRGAGLKPDPPTGPYRTAREMAAYLRTTLKGFDSWARANGVPHVKRGRVRLFDIRKVERVLDAR